MKKSIAAVLLVAAAAGAQAADLKIAVVDPMQAISDSAPAKRMLGALEKDLTDERAQLGKLEGQLRTCQQKLGKDAATLAATEVAKLKAECDTKYREYQNLGQSVQKTATERQQAILQEMGPRFQTALGALIKEGGYDVVVQREALLHVKPELDITGKVTAKIDAASSAGK